MSQDYRNFDPIAINDWSRLYQQENPALTPEELETLKSLNDNISIEDVNDIYLPLVNLIKIYQKTTDDLSFAKSLFLNKKPHHRPFMIGISGSVAVGKSTTSRLLQLLLSRAFPHASVSLVTTDGFLYSNSILKQKNLMNRKGFPESYHMEGLLDFLDKMRNGETSTIPIYSHEIYDILPNQGQTINSPDFLIIEGINIFQTGHNDKLFIADYFDFSIYIDAEVNHIKQWYIERFKKLIDLAKRNTSNHYHRFSQMPLNEALAIAENTWKKINHKNLMENILPTRNRADLILHKDKNHKIDKIYLKK